MLAKRAGHTAPGHRRRKGKRVGVWPQQRPGEHNHARPEKQRRPGDHSRNVHDIGTRQIQVIVRAGEVFNVIAVEQTRPVTAGYP